MRISWPLILACTIVTVASTQSHSQGLPDIVWEVDHHTHSATGVAYAPDGSFVASGAGYDDCSVRLWLATDGTPAGDFSVYPHGILSVDVAPDGPYVAVGYIVSGYPPGGVSAVWDTELEEELFTTGGCYVSFSPGGDMLASGGGGVNRYLFLTQVSDGFQLHSIYTGSYIHDVAYSPDGRVVATAGSDNAVQLWDPATGSLIRTLTGHEDDVSAVAFSPDGVLLASGAGGWDDPGESTIKIWRVSDGELLDTLEGHGEWVSALAFSPDGGVLVSSGRTGSTPKIKFWDIVTGEMTRYYDDSALDIDFSPDGQYFTYGRSGGNVVLARSGLLSGIEGPSESRTRRLALRSFPEPFNPMTQIEYELPHPGRVTLRVYNLSGRLVRELLDSVEREEGSYAVPWYGRGDSGRPLPSGVYFARLDAGEETAVHKMVLLK